MCGRNSSLEGSRVIFPSTYFPSVLGNGKHAASTSTQYKILYRTLRQGVQCSPEFGLLVYMLIWLTMPFFGVVQATRIELDVALLSFRLLFRFSSIFSVHAKSRNFRVRLGPSCGHDVGGRVFYR